VSCSILYICHHLRCFFLPSFRFIYFQKQQIKTFFCLLEDLHGLRIARIQAPQITWTVRKYLPVGRSKLLTLLLFLYRDLPALFHSWGLFLNLLAIYVSPSRKLQASRVLVGGVSADREDAIMLRVVPIEQK
jgi:hypothetical protein